MSTITQKLDTKSTKAQLARLFTGLCLMACLVLSTLARAHASATLFLGEPYSYDGALAGTGHAAVYLSGVCANSPTGLRPCAPGETGIVLSRYHRVAGYDWIAIPLIPYLYAVENRDDIPLFADKKLTAFLRDQYRRNHLEALIPDLPGGSAPEGDWYELVGASYIRTIYAYEIATTPAEDAALIRKLNGRPNRDRYNLVTANCADFVRQIINFYHPHAVHRSIVGDLGVTTPKQAAITLSKYSRHHPEFAPENYVIPQIPGSLPRSKPVHGVLESALTAKKYMLPLFVLHPYVAGSLIIGYFGHGRFNPSQNAMVLDANNHLDQPPSRAERRNLQDRFDEILVAIPDADEVTQRHWAAQHAAAEPTVDASGHAFLEVPLNGDVTDVGITRANILTDDVDHVANYEFAVGLLKARLREELKSAPARKSALADVENDLTLLEQLMTLRSEYSPAPAVALNAKQTHSRPLPLEPPPVKANPLP
jgi:hypothetical protein